MDSRRDVGVPPALVLVQRSLQALNHKRRVEGLTPVEEVRYRNLCELEEKLLDGLAS